MTRRKLFIPLTIVSRINYLIHVSQDPVMLPPAADAAHRELRRFGIVVGFLFGALAAWMRWRGHPAVLWLMVPGGVLVLLGFLVPAWLKYPYKFWMALGHALGYINSRIILGFLFFVVMTPMAMVMRVFGRDALALRFRTDAASYWEVRKEPFTLEGLKNQF